MAEPLHKTVGLVSAVAYLLSAVIVFATFVIFQFATLPIIAAIHMCAVIVAVTATIGMVFWWIMEQRTPPVVAENVK
ncbi:hypothetical protein M199_gp184 [Halogranum tailed virus 1]|uniref:Uncharacterized protein n=1 Tax=Halogranum tailed virus 1 TaxID=1273749 RepID=R4TLC5_9CAUD|nr:hypothetical protein M199_gp184 [Halogranum tailed virus 1]AGM11482.1 hypothetical protein HGTV1_185 [Halogranum tailed virus 1]